MNQDVGQGGLSLRGVSRHGRNRHNRQNHHACLLVLYFVRQAEGGEGALQNRQNRQNRQTVMKATPLKLKPPFPTS